MLKSFVHYKLDKIVQQNTIFCTCLMGRNFALFDGYPKTGQIDQYFNRWVSEFTYKGFLPFTISKLLFLQVLPCLLSTKNNKLKPSMQKACLTCFFTQVITVFQLGQGALSVIIYILVWVLFPKKISLERSVSRCIPSVCNSQKSCGSSV